MSVISSREIEYIENLVNRGMESTILDFKREWYKLNKQKYKDIYRENIFEFIKDCISFLNVGMETDKYIIIGIDENKKNGTFFLYEINERYEENNLQELIAEYIDPIPQIDIITKVKIGEHEIDIIKIRKENKDQPYLFKKSFQKKQNDKFERMCTGLGYIRHGSSSHIISRNELTNMYFKKQGNIYGYLDYNLDIKYDYFIDIMLFLDCMDSMINRNSLDLISSNNVIFKSKFMNVFNELVIEGNLFFENVDRENLKGYVCKMIMDNKSDYFRVKEVLDGGENSLIILIFCACYCYYKISVNPKVDCSITNDVVMIKFEDETLDGDEYREIDKYVRNINNIINDINNLSFNYNKNIKLLKISKMKYDNESSKYFVQSNIKFKVSEDIIPLLIEPLYKQGNKMEIALREMMQNSIDACKMVDTEGYIGQIEIEIKIEENKNILAFNDNGIGMNLDDIREYYLTVGRSKKKLSDIPVVGKFGIGALSMFLIGKKAIVRTKKTNDNEYRFELFEDKKRVSDLTKKICDNNESYTKIEIELSEEVKSKDLEGLIKELCIEKLVINKENLNIQFKFCGDVYNVPNINNRNNDFETIFKEGELLVLFYDEEKENYNIDKENELEKKKIEDVNLEKIIKSKGVVLYNDILTKAEYNFDNYRNLKTTSIPFIVISGKTSEEEVSVELSRKSANIGETISKAIVDKIYRNEIRKIIEYLKENQNTTNSIKMKSELTKLVKNYIKLPTLLLGKNKIILSNSKMYDKEHINNKVLVIHSNSLTDECFNSSMDELFVMNDISFNKSKIADMIVAGKVRLISAKFLFKYIISAHGSKDGFRMDALKILLKNMLPNISWNLGHDDLWKAIEMKKMEICEVIKRNSLYDIYCFDNSNKDIISRIFSSKVQDRDLIVYFRSIKEIGVEYSYDKLFDELFTQAYYYQDTDVLESVAVTLSED